LFACHFLAVIVRRESHIERLGLARLHADDGLLKVGQHASRTQHHRKILGFTALEHRTIQLAGEIDAHLIVALCGTVGLLEHRTLFAQGRDGLFHIRIAQGERDSVHALAGDVADGDFRIDLEGRTVFDLRRVQVRGLDLEMRITRHLQLVADGSLGKGALQALAQYFLLHRRAILLLQHLERHLARAETMHFGRAADAFQPRLNFAAQLLLGDGCAQTALQST
jgi:hypothetical protein